ncbi:peptidoglycan bridge formation glycyltransferase FemA/FemB family protein [Candidatus Gottesmanbacteria bacterium]|nr:peptidoglycan bridge formation glycyltransferase FemA/FemB family protein [Candidatus Gottesmanbacteria bacterium]
MYSISEINNKEKWENFIKDYSPQSYFQSWNWGDVIKTTGSNIKRIGLFHKKELIGLSQITTLKAKRGTFLHIRNGPILKAWNPKSFKILLDYLHQYAKEEEASFIRISPLIPNTQQNIEFVTKFGFRPAPIHAMDGEYVWVLDLNKPEEEILRVMRKTTRYLIKRAQKMGVEVKISNNINDFYSLYRETAKRHGFIEHKEIEEEFNIFSKEGNAILFVGKYHGKLISAAIIVFYQNQAIYRHGASIPSDIPVSYLIQWQGILEAKKRRISIYNFFGIAPPNKTNHPWNGITLFKTGFGGRVISYLHAQDKALSPKYWLNYLVEWTRKVKKGYT